MLCENINCIMIEMYKGYIEKRDECLIKGFFLMTVIERAQDFSTLSTEETFRKNVKNIQMCIT